MSLPLISRRVAIGIAISLAPYGAPTALAQTTELPAASPAVSGPDTHGVALDDSILGEERGGQAIVIGNQTLQSSLTGNTIAGNYTAGAISLSDNAFANFNGMGNVVINSGAQANLQSAMNLTVNLGH